MFCVESSYASGCRLVLCRNVLQSCTSFVSFRCSSVSYVVGPCILDCWLRGWVCASGCKDSQGLIVPNFLRRSTCNQTLEDEVRFLPNTGFTLWLDCSYRCRQRGYMEEGRRCFMCIVLHNAYDSELAIRPWAAVLKEGHVLYVFHSSDG